MKFKLILKIVVFFILFSLAISSQADDLLDILDNKENKISMGQDIVQTKSELVASLEKRLQPLTAEQRIFLHFFGDKKYEKALYQWPSAFSGKKFRKTATGKALYSYILFKNKLEVNAVETLFSLQDPENIDRLLKREWRELLKPENPVWEIANIRWKPVWTSIFDQKVEMAVLSHKPLDIKNQKRVLALLRKTSENTKARSWLQWQAALSLAMNDDLGKSAKILRLLLDMKEDHVGKDLIRITIGRLLFEKGYLDAAIKYYRQIPKSSEFWFTAQEEKAWAYLRKGEPQNTLAVTRSLVSKHLRAFAGPEALFLSSLAHLKVCNYKEAAAHLTKFKVHYKVKAKNLIHLVKNGEQPAVEKALNKLKRQKIRLVKLGPEAMFLPLYISRDKVLRNYVRLQVALNQEAKISSALYANSLTDGTAEIGFQAFLEDLNKASQLRAKKARQASISLIQKRAQAEILEIRDVLQKMHIVEAEILQQVLSADRVIKASHRRPDSESVGTSQKASRFALRFPFVGERWFDEIGHYQMSLKNGCKAK